MRSAWGWAKEALRLMERQAYYANRVEWAAVRDQVKDRLRDGESMVQALRPVVAALDDRHSFITPAGSWNERRRRHQQERPDGKRLADGIGYLSIPAVSADPRSDVSLDYVEAAYTVLRTHPSPRGWVIDLRGNGGGTVHPMLAAVAPLLGAEVFLSYQRRQGTGAEFSHQPGRLLNQGRTSMELPRIDPSPGLPVAILHDSHTASSGEGVVVAFAGRDRTRTFGSPTAGVPTGNILHRMADEAVLAVTVSVAVDRLGRQYTDSIPPREPATGLDRALQWLTK
jgi:C-terminal processing protease CtpA/Prc